MPNIKMVTLKDYAQYLNQMLYIGELILKIYYMAFGL
jgi:hypothetical protein